MFVQQTDESVILPNKFVEIKINGETRTVEIHHVSTKVPVPEYPRMRYWEHWSTDADVALCKIGHGQKLWASNLYVWFDGNGNMKVQAPTINNRNNTSVVRWNDVSKESGRRSQHNGQKHHK